MTDIVRRLRAMSRNEHDDLSIGDEAADEIERLRAEVANAVDAYKKSLKPVAYMNPEWVKGELWPDDCFIDPGLSIPEDWVPLYRIDGESDE